MAKIRSYVVLLVAVAMLLFACAAPAAPTAAPTKPVAAPAATSALAAAATKPAAAAPTAVPTAKIKRGGELRSAELGHPTLDPHTSTASHLPTNEMLYNSLFRNVSVDPAACIADAKKCQFELRGELVEKWEKPDPQTYIFRLRKGVKFHDGSEWNADAATWNLNRLGTHAKSIGKDTVASIKSIDIVDPYTLKVNLKAPTAILLNSLSSAGSLGRSRIISKAAMEKLGEDEFGRKPVGSGPFKLREWLRDNKITLDRFESYWDMGVDGKPLPYLDSAVMRYFDNEELQGVDFKGGGLDIIAFRAVIPPQEIPSIKNNPNMVYWEWGFAGDRRYFLINAQNEKNPVLSQDLKLRQAIAYSIDRDAMAKTMGQGIFGYAEYRFWPVGGLGYDESLPKYTYNVDKAKQLLKESGYAGQEFDFITYRPDGQKVAQIYQQMLGAIGIKTRLTHMERLAWVEANQSHKYDMSDLAQGFTADPVIQERNYRTTGLGNYEGQQNKEMDKCMDEGASSDDPKVRHEAYRRCDQIATEMAYRITTYTLPFRIAWYKYVKGVEASGGEVWYPNKVWLDK